MSNGPASEDLTWRCEPDIVLASTYDFIARDIAENQKKEFDVEDFASAFIKFKNGTSLIIETSWACNIKQAELMQTRLLGTKGGLLNYNLNEGYEFRSEMFVEKNGIPMDISFHTSRYDPKINNPMFHFVDSIINDTPNMATAEEGVKVMKILDGIYESAETGEAVKLKSR